MKKSIRTIAVAVLLLVASCLTLLTAFADTPPTEPLVCYRLNMEYDTETLWASDSTKNAMQEETWGHYHKTEWPSPTLLTWAGYTYDPDELSLANVGTLQWYTKQGPGNLGTENPGVAVSLKLYYDPEDTTFQGFNINSDAPFAKVSSTGRFYTYATSAKSEDDTVEIGQLTAGWNTLTFYLLPTYEGESIVNYKVYFSMSLPDVYIPAEEITSMPCFTWGITDLFVNVKSTFKFSGNGGKFTFKHFKASTLTEIADAKQATFTGYEDRNTILPAGTEMTLPRISGVDLWQANGVSYRPGDTFVLNADTVFTPVCYEHIYTLTQGYDSDTLWSTGYNPQLEEQKGNTIKEDTFGCYHITEYYTPNVIWWKDYTYDPTDCAVTLTSTKADGNGLQWYLQRPAAQYSGCQTMAMSMQVLYEQDAFDGLSILAYYSTVSGSLPLAKIDSSGRFYTYTTAAHTEDATLTVGQLSEGWNTVTMFFIADYADDGTTVSSYETYFALNQTVGTDILAEDLAEMPHIAWVRGALTDQVSLLFRIWDADATAEAPVTLSFKGLKSWRMEDKILASVFFGSAAATVKTPLGTQITLPEAEGIVGWKLDSTVYAPGATYTVSDPAVTFAGLDATAYAYEELSAAVADLNDAGEDTRVEKILALHTALQNSLLDREDARYTAASDALRAAVTSYETAVTARLAAAQEATVLTDRFTALREAISLCLPLREVISETTLTALTQAVTAYNTVVASVNAEVTDAVTAAVAVSVYKLPNTDMVAILADIKSKVEN